MENSPSRPFLAYPAGGQETTFYLRVASTLVVHQYRQLPCLPYVDTYHPGVPYPAPRCPDYTLHHPTTRTR